MEVHSYCRADCVTFELEESVLALGSPLASPRTRGIGGWGDLEVMDVALEFGAGETTAAPDVDRAQVSRLHERIHGRAADAEQPGGLLGGEQQRLVVPCGSESVGCGHRFSSDLVAIRTPTAGAERPWEKAPISAVW
jgi:hypothetical protein